MSGSSVASTNVVTNFDSKVFREYVRGGRFGPYIGNNENSVIQVPRDMQKHSLPLIAKLKGAGVSGSSSLVGNEEPLSNYSFTFTPTYHRHGVLVDNEENEKSNFSLRQEARPALMNWMMEKKRNQMIQALGAIEAGGTYYNYGGGGTSGATGATAASATNMDTWNTNNQDRILYGAATSNNTSGNHTTSLATLDGTADTLSRSIVELTKRLAEHADPIIRPVMVNGDEPYFVMFVGGYAFRDLRADLATEHQNAMPRSVEGNPLWTGGDLMVDNVIIKKIPEIDALFIDGSSTSEWDGVWGANCDGDGHDNAGLLGIRTSACFLCGAQAMVFGVGREASIKRRKEDDYEHLAGVGIAAKHDIKKVFYNNKQHGMVTTFVAAAAD